jgi:O-antigen ligase
VPVFALCIYFTLSRGGIVAAATGVLVLAGMFPERRRLRATVALTGAASAILVAAAAQRPPLGRDLVGGAALHRGDELAAVLVIVMAGTAAVQAALALLGEPAANHAWSRRIRALAPERRPAALVATALAAVLIAGGATAATGWPGEAWQRFKSPAVAQHLDGQGDASRLASLSSNGRYEIWSAATDALAAHPIRGTGAGTFAFWWLRRAPIDQTVADAHSLYLELGAETGVPGVMIGLGFLGALLSAGWGARRLDPGARIAVAAAVAAAWSFCMSAAVDWVWELPVIPVAVLILAAAAFACRRERLDAVVASRRRRIAVAAGALAPGAVLLVVLASAGAVEQSRASARAGDLPAALRQARAAHAIAPGAATPLLQSGLVREAAGDLRGAAADVREAIRREPENWRGPLVLSRLEARLGHARAAVAAFRRARTLNPRHPIFGP